jgi:hypothetical protein
MWISREQWQPLVIIAVGTAVWWIAVDVIRSRRIRRVKEQKRLDTTKLEQERKETAERAAAAVAAEAERLQNLMKEKREQLDQQLDTFFNTTHKDWFWRDDLVQTDNEGYSFIDLLVERSEDTVTELVEDASISVDGARQSLAAYLQTLETQVQQQTVKTAHDKYVKRYSPEWKWLEGAITDLFGKSEPCKNGPPAQHACYGCKWMPPFPEVEPVFNTLLKKWYQYEEGTNLKPEQRADFLRGYKVDSSESRFAVPSCKRIEFASWMRSFIAQVREYAKEHSDLATPLASFVLLYGVWSTAMSAIENKTAEGDYVFILSITFVQAVFDLHPNRTMLENIREALSRADAGFSSRPQRALLQEIMAYPIRQSNVLTYLVGKAWTGETEIKELKPDALRQALCRNETFQRLAPAFTLNAFPNPLQYRIARAKENVFTWTTRTGNLSTAVRDTEWKWTKQALETFANDSSDSSIDAFLKKQNWGTIIVFHIMKRVLEFFLDVWLNEQAQQWEETKEDNPAIQTALDNCKRAAKDGVDLIQERLLRLLQMTNGATQQKLQQTLYEALYTYQEVQKSSVDLIRAAWVASEVKPSAPSFLGAALIAHCWFTYYRNFFFYGKYQPERSFRNVFVPQGETEFERRLLPYFWNKTRELTADKEYPVGEFRSYYFEYDGKESVRHRDENVKSEHYPRSWLRLFIMNEWKPDYGTSRVLITKASSWGGPEVDLRNWLSGDKSIPEMELDESVLPVATLIKRLLFAITLNPNF